MKSSTRLEKAIFHLTPTRTRCDLIIIANEKKEKIASGLLKPFLTHLRTAEDQIAKGGYSILLEPEPDNDAIWFTKGTMERFVRFVSTPEILERVDTIESEILQIEEAIAFQGSSDAGLNTIEDHLTKPVGSSEGNKQLLDASEEKAIVLYKPGSQLPETNGSMTQEENSKVQLLKVMQTRKTVLQKEQGMAFARAVAAGFDLDHLAPLLSFAKCFGASRLMNACLRFMDLWKGKHETGQWLEIDAAEVMSSRSDFSAMNASGIMLSSVANKHNESHCEMASGANGKAGAETSADERPTTDRPAPVGQQEYFQGQFPHPMFPAWPMHSPPGSLPMFQAYPLQGMPYYQNYPGNGPYYQPPYPPVEDSRFGVGHGGGQKRQSMDSRDSNPESDPWEDSSKMRSQDDFELEKGASHGQEPRRRGGRSGKRQSGMVVIRNINYITSKRQNSSGSESDSASGPETNEETGELDTDASDMMHKNTSRSSNKKGREVKSTDELNSNETNDIYVKDRDGAQWQAFQNCLLRGAAEDSHAANDDMFAVEKNVQMKRRQNTLGDDPLALGGRDPTEMQDRKTPDFQKVSGTVSHMPRVSNDEIISRGEGYYGNGGGLTDDRMDIQFIETNGRKILRRRIANDDFVIGGQENGSDLGSSSNPLAVNRFECDPNNLDQNSSHAMADESFIIPFRSMSIDQDDDRTAIDIDVELPSMNQKSENSSSRIGSQVYLEPDDLSLMPERGTEKIPIGYDPALDYEMQVCVEDAASQDRRNKQVANDDKQGSRKLDKDQKAKVTPDSLEKKKTGGPIRKAKPSKASPLEAARARAERLRTYKADLQKMKKEKEEAELKRLETLKMERQKRIAARVNSASASSPSPSMQTQKQLSTNRGSKFSDAETGSSSPLQRSKIRPASLGSSDSQKASMASKPRDGSHLAGNRLNRSLSSLSEPKKESAGTTPDSKASMARIRRLSEPKTISSHLTSSVKVQSAEPAKLKVVDGPESKKTINSHPTSSVKVWSVEPKPKVVDVPESKKISAIMNLDKSKAATLPELKIRTSKGTLNVGQNKSAGKEMTLKKNGSKPSVISESAELSINEDKISHQSDMDDNPVIEKTVVMLECQKPFNPIAQASEEMGMGHYDNRATGEKIEVVSEYAAIRAPPSPVDGVNAQPIPRQLQEQLGHYEMAANCAEREAPAIANANTVEKPYQAPFARVSSLEDPCTGNSEYGKAPPRSLEVLSTSAETARAHISDFKNLKLEKIPENLEKPQVKDSSKGFRRLLKFARKNHGSSAGERGLESDNGSVIGSEPDDNAKRATSSEVHTLKNLISQDETPNAANTSHKSTRHFSLLSPFRSKTSEKKMIT